MRNPHEWRQASAAGLERAKLLSWDTVAQEWTTLFEQELTKPTSTLAGLGTLANHFYRRSDIYAAKEVLARLPADYEKARWVRERIAQDWAFTETPNGFREQYEKIGKTQDSAGIDWAPSEPRYAALLAWLKLHNADVHSVLAYGCAHGAYAVNLLKELTELLSTGGDLDLHGIQMAYEFANKLGVTSRWRGVVGDHTRLADDKIPEMA